MSIESARIELRNNIISDGTNTISDVTIDELPRLLPKLIYHGAVCRVTRTPSGTYNIAIERVKA